ncbi:hypothetical protein RHMOL_Rhmol10G0019400 [Rhododendron molle]|uniref:Uncharacterized protein n=1 Tax=Rhododendron molle TaxID=49168 RepID=A0ACC0LZE3_RHOML|nr:hypothetical protein RHMOL_Rhmol10G0019400 [Rhododendron molle]
MKRLKREKRVVMGRNLLFIDRDLRPSLEVGGKFQFFHRSSQSVVEVQHMEHFHEEMQATEESHVKSEPIPMDNIPKPINPVTNDDDASCSLVRPGTEPRFHSSSGEMRRIGGRVLDSGADRPIWPFISARMTQI